jgi:uncharacterized repeat protein (TIGR03803 family)
MLHTSQTRHYGTLLLIATLAPAAAAQSNFSTIYAFNADGSAGDGKLPLVLLTGGTSAHPVLYGTTLQGGPLTAQCTSGCGTVFSLTPLSPADTPWTETQIYNFTAPADGLGPNTLLLGPSGVLYGTTSAGGTDGYGTAFSLTPPSASGQPWTKSTFQVTTNLEFWIPDSMSLVNGVLYGVSQGGGYGTFFSLIPPNGSTQTWTFTLLLNLYPAFEPMVLTPGGSGVFYLTSNANVLDKCSNCGGVFSLTSIQPTGPWTGTLLWGFGGSRHGDGNGFSAVAVASGGVLYGVTNDGGTHGFGTVFSLTPPASPGAPWTETLLYNFAGGKDAAYPNPSVVLDAQGVLYGTSSNGGDPSCPLYYASGCGTVFSLTPPTSSGAAWTEKVLHAFHAGNDGAFPLAGITLGPNGTLYGTTTAAGGQGKYGTVFAVHP